MNYLDESSLIKSIYIFYSYQPRAINASAIRGKKKYEDIPYKIYLGIGILSKDAYNTMWIKLSTMLNTNQRLINIINKIPEILKEYPVPNLILF